MKQQPVILSSLIIMMSLAPAFANVNESQIEKKPSMRKIASVAECTEQPDFLNEKHFESLTSFEKLPKSIYVAKEAEFYLEGRSESGQTVRAYSVQSFSNKESKRNAEIICANTTLSESKRFSMQAPTLIDLSPEKKVGNSVWQFQLLSQDKNFKVWNRQSPTLSQKPQLDQLMKDFGSKYQIFQISHNEYEVVFRKQIDGIEQFLSIKYEAYPTLHE